LRAQRDELAGRIAALRAPAPAGRPSASPAPAADSTRSATRPGVTWKLSFGT
ncbi:MAG: hypothetical protein JWM73_1355, partial [Solirubrobacterales bacterium]|nr:hypothetical protein [Solirubrobacterales bacterium]